MCISLFRRSDSPWWGREALRVPEITSPSYPQRHPMPQQLNSASKALTISSAQTRAYRASGQHGITLIESLIAILVAALGILGIIGVQLRTLADTQTTVRREQAIRLIEDFSERMKISPNALVNMGSYTSGWSTSLPTPDAGTSCTTGTCTPAQLAAYDLAEWKQLVQASLPMGDANVFQATGETVAANRRQLGIMIRWRENEKNQDADYLSNLQISAAANGSGGTAVTCDTGYTCHLQYIPVSARCAPYNGTATTRYFCPGN